MLMKYVVVASVLLMMPRLALVQEPILLTHDGWVAAVAFAPDGKTLASAGADNVVRLWEVGTWKPKGVLKGHTDCVCAVAYSSDGKWLATGSFDHTAKVWNVEKLRDEETLKHKGVVSAVLIDKSLGKFLVMTGGVEGTVRFWEAAQDGVEHQHKSWVNGLATHGTRGVSASSDGTLRLFDVDNDQSLEGGAGEVRTVAFSPDGKRLAAGNRYGTVRIWDVASRKEIKTLTGHMGDVWSIAFSPDGKTLAAVDTDWKKPSKVKLYDTTTWKERGSLSCPGEILSIGYSPKGDWLAAGSWDKTVRLFAIK
ncbi:MAG: WD40 repeat domain-containing protein [Gemmataceae bacterium]|nr:WD40 repeat domain-containing protein [Gemmataceae bacterium]